MTMKLMNGFKICQQIKVKLIKNMKKRHIFAIETIHVKSCKKGLKPGTAMAIEQISLSC